MGDQNGIFLIVDDEQDMCWALEHLLGKKGFITKKALSGQEAIQLIERHRFQLAFLDIKLPDMDGLELARRIQEIDSLVSIVMVSGYYYTDDLEIKQALSEGLICGFISKPFQHHEILKMIETSSRPNPPPSLN